MPPLPPLPPRAQWKTLWPRSLLRYSMDRTNREFNGRVLLASTRLADEFTKALKIRSNEVIIEAFSGPGILTRSLLSGGLDTNPNTDSRDTQSSSQEGKDKKEDGREYNKPAVVLACEPSPKLLTYLGLEKEKLPDEIPARFESEDYRIYQSNVFQSKDEERLLLSPSTPYRWPTLTQLLGNKMIARHMKKWDMNHDTTTGMSGNAEIAGTGQGEGEEKHSEDPIDASTQRPWDAPPPPITIVAQMPVSVGGDQMVAQWVGSCAGTPGEERSWIWKWGRLRLALLVGKTPYDRMMAGPGEAIHCKLSIMTQALFHLSPLPPYHHVFNVDKSSNRTTSTPIRPTMKSQTKAAKALREQQEIPPPLPLHETHVTYPDDFHPVSYGLAKHLDIPLPRPELLGIMLEPRKDSPITSNNKEEWDYVLRKCFVTEAQSLGSTLKNLAFGAEGLVDKIEDGLNEHVEPIGEATTGQSSAESTEMHSGKGENTSYKSKWRGKAVPRTRIIRDMSVEEWTRVVDVFTRWPFKPDNLMLDNRPGEDIRQIGGD